ncbi:MAG: hypothetical protein K9K76_06030, partial [Halanaerobiales bacterium]|nr:hypothetical protein [Halanaerobiales bacterium]
LRGPGFLRTPNWGQTMPRPLPVWPRSGTLRCPVRMRLCQGNYPDFEGETTKGLNIKIYFYEILIEKPKKIFSKIISIHCYK